MEYEKFINNFSNYVSSFELTKDEVRSLKLALNEVKNFELPSRDENKLFQIRNFLNSDNLEINLISKNLWCKQDRANGLLVGTLFPDWQTGWKKFCKDEFISEQIGNFFFLVTQYICRSYQINLIAAISFTYNRNCDFRGDRLWQYSLPNCEKKFMDFNNSISIKLNSRIRILQHYLELINSLEPYVNKAIFYYIKSIDLYNKGFLEETITNLDNVIDTISQYIKKILSVPTMPRKDMIQLVAKEIQLSHQVQYSLENLYLLRCRFSSHPAQSKWWDFGEIYDGDIETLIECVKYVLLKMLQYEANNRKVSNNPDKWSNWFADNANMLFEAVWFHRLPNVIR